MSTGLIVPVPSTSPIVLVVAWKIMPLVGWLMPIFEGHILFPVARAVPATTIFVLFAAKAQTVDATESYSSLQ